MVVSSGDRGGDSSGAALGARAGKGAPRPPSPSSPLPPAGSRFWALSPSEDGSDVDELASVEDFAQQVASDGVAGRAPVTLGPFIDRALGSPGWTRAGRGRHGRFRAAGAGPAAAAPPRRPQIQGDRWTLLIFRPCPLCRFPVRRRWALAGRRSSRWESSCSRRGRRRVRWI
jgi:hypothetical protein